MAGQSAITGRPGSCSFIKSKIRSINAERQGCLAELAYIPEVETNGAGAVIVSKIEAYLDHIQRFLKRGVVAFAVSN